jgi:hypothetical protein
MNETEKEKAIRDLVASGGSMETLISQLHTQRRKLELEQARARQPQVSLSDGFVDAIRDELRRQPTVDEMTPSGMDYLCLSVQDCIDSGNLTDIMFALARVWRKAWFLQPHLGPITQPKT